MKRLTYDRAWELVVVNNGSTDGTEALLRDLRGDFLPQLVIVDEPEPGLGRARNTGVRACRGELVVFTDDDCYPSDDLLLMMADVFKDPTIGFAGGRLLLYDPTDYRVAIVERTDRREVRPGEFIAAGLISGANMAVRRAAFEAVGGFDGDLGAGTPFPCEDVDLQARLSAAGWKGVYDPRLVVHHHHRRKTRAEAQALERSYDIGRGAYYARCLRNPTLRRVCAKAWLRSLRRGRFARSLREIVGALRYVTRR